MEDKTETTIKEIEVKINEIITLCKKIDHKLRRQKKEAMVDFISEMTLLLLLFIIFVIPMIIIKNG